MKKLTLILLVLISCSGINTEFDIINSTSNWADGTSPDTIIGTSSYRVLRNFRVFWNNTRNDEDGLQALNTPTKIGGEYDLAPAIGFENYRIGVIFDITPIPMNVRFDSVLLQLYKTSSGLQDNRVVIYNSRYIKADGSTDDFGKIVNGWNVINIQDISALNDYTTINLYNIVPISYYYGLNYACYGIGEYLHDYLDDSYGLVSNYIEFDLSKSRLIIYYSDMPTPSPKKIKIIGVI